MRLRDTPGLTFDDVLLVPKRSSVASRSAVTTASRLTRRLTLAIPIVSANMDTVTEAPMAIAIVTTATQTQRWGVAVILPFLLVGFGLLWLGVREPSPEPA